MSHVILKFLDSCKENLYESIVNFFHVIVQSFMRVFFAWEDNKALTTGFTAQDSALYS